MNEDEVDSGPRRVARPEDELVRAKQAARAKLMALILGAFVVLMFAITIAKMSINQ
jgi:hypothetical protein